MKRIILKPCSLINILGKRKIAFICAEIEIEPHKRSTNGANIIKCVVFIYTFMLRALYHCLDAIFVVFLTAGANSIGTKNSDIHGGSQTTDYKHLILTNGFYLFKNVEI